MRIVVGQHGAPGPGAARRRSAGRARTRQPRARPRRPAASLMASLIRSSCCTRAPTYRAIAGTEARSDSTTELRPTTNSAASQTARRAGGGAGRRRRTSARRGGERVSAARAAARPGRRARRRGAGCGSGLAAGSHGRAAQRGAGQDGRGARARAGSGPCPRAPCGHQPPVPRAPACRFHAWTRNSRNCQNACHGFGCPSRPFWVSSTWMPISSRPSLIASRWRHRARAASRCCRVSLTSEPSTSRGRFASIRAAARRARPRRRERVQAEHVQHGAGLDQASQTPGLVRGRTAPGCRP